MRAQHEVRHCRFRVDELSGRSRYSTPFQKIHTQSDRSNPFNRHYDSRTIDPAGRARQLKTAMKRLAESPQAMAATLTRLDSWAAECRKRMDADRTERPPS